MVKKQKVKKSIIQRNRKVKNIIFSSIKKSNALYKRKPIYDTYLANEVLNELINIYDHNNDGIKYNTLSTQIDEFLKNSQIQKLEKLRYKSFNLSSQLERIIEDSSKIMTIKEIHDKLTSFHPSIKKSQSTVRRTLIKSGIKHRWINFRHYKSTGIKASISSLLFANELIRQKKQNHIFLYLDESSFNCNLKSHKAWVKSNSSKYFESPGRIPSITAIGIISEYGLLKYNISLKTFKSSDFINFIKDLAIDIEASPTLAKSYNSNQLTIILDNSRNHTCKASLNGGIKQTKFNAIFQPGYSPFFNSIEKLWSLVKRKRRKQSIMNV